MAETVWSVLPPIITIVLALATKEVYIQHIEICVQQGSGKNTDKQCAECNYDLV